MINYWHIETKREEEKNCQHEICLKNNADAPYFVLDLEYEVSSRSEFYYIGKKKTSKGNTPKPRFDIIAIRKADHRLCVIELKKGLNALDGKSGLQDHVDSFSNSIDASTNNWKSFVEEMDTVLEQKKQLGLVNTNVYIDKDLEPIFLFAYQEDSNDVKHKGLGIQKKIFKHYQEKPYKGACLAAKVSVIWLKDGDFELKDS